MKLILALFVVIVGLSGLDMQTVTVVVTETSTKIETAPSTSETEITGTSDKTAAPSETPTPTAKPTEQPPATTDKPTEKPTDKPTTHANPTSTTAAPKPGTWTVSDGGNVCIVANFQADMTVQYKINENTTGTGEIKFPKEQATVDKTDSHCGNNTQVLKLNFAISDSPPDIKPSSLTLTFEKTSDKILVESISLELHNFKTKFNDSAIDDITLTKLNLTLFQTNDGHSFYCSKGSKVDLSDTSSVTFTELQVEAFKTGSDKDFSLAEDCNEDISNVVPIAVGCALAALVVVVLIAYLVGRRHKRQRGYESV